MKFWTFTLATQIQSVHKTLQLMVMYLPIKFGSKRVSSSVDVVELLETIISYCMAPNCDFDLEDMSSKPIFSKDALAHDDASPYHA